MRTTLMLTALLSMASRCPRRTRQAAYSGGLAAYSCWSLDRRKRLAAEEDLLVPLSQPANVIVRYLLWYPARSIQGISHGLRHVGRICLYERDVCEGHSTD